MVSSPAKEAEPESQLLVIIGYVRGDKVEIDSGCSEVSMTENFLETSNVPATFEVVDRKAMAEGMRSDSMFSSSVFGMEKRGSS